MLGNLPPEILSQICLELPSAQAVRGISLTNHRLHNFVQDEGWKIFVQTYFPSYLNGLASTINYSEAAKSLTALSKSWDRRALLVKTVQPSPWDLRYGTNDTSRSRRPWAAVSSSNGSNYAIGARTRRRGQTMGFQPAVDSQEEIIGGDWTSRREYLVWGAGPQLGFRVRCINADPIESWQATTEEHGNLIHWTWYHPDNWRDGQDDITALKMLSSSFVQEHTHARWPFCSVMVIVGNASGTLKIFDINLTHSPPDASAWLSGSYVLANPNGSAVRSLDISPSGEHVAAMFADGKLSVYHLVRTPSSSPGRQKCALGSFEFDLTDLQATLNSLEDLLPISTLQVDTKKYGHTWACSFLSDDRIAVGSGRSFEPLQVYTITSSGISQQVTLGS
ncbi:hypothetical protein BT63DRAFT_917 [Microthyrium microscopicum]|uniref:F-box domain-containing protein n=1 Tax=Microthyrium microscopicum TaxID=703497 RepID=A0A6A6URJ8_9PEZI|nr:hypothetical protein BT63DRAFT_917 [Microthyrium microscopicum]